MSLSSEHGKTDDGGANPLGQRKDPEPAPYDMGCHQHWAIGQKRNYGKKQTQLQELWRIIGESLTL